MGFINEQRHILELVCRVQLHAKLVQYKAHLVTEKKYFH